MEGRSYISVGLGVVSRNGKLQKFLHYGGLKPTTHLLRLAQCEVESSC
jgi:hypothetical protein